MKTKLFFSPAILIAVVLFASSVFGIDFYPQGNINLEWDWNVTNASTIFCKDFNCSSCIDSYDVLDIDVEDIEGDVNTFVDVAGDGMVGTLHMTTTPGSSALYIHSGDFNFIDAGFSGYVFGDGSKLTGIVSGNFGFFVGLSASDQNGILNSADGSTGYKAANYICNADYAGSHLCTTDEIFNSIVSEDISGWAGTGWIGEGPPGYLATANDCYGFTSSSATALGAWWNFNSVTGGEGWLINCSTLQKLACCG